mmetsp:Transcript_9489/g.10930  ORF Transcript_9489/g.10930 Transcript_9489/m.10930 type:complete len:244 (+) Transcript_9489:126-857(+)
MQRRPVDKDDPKSETIEAISNNQDSKMLKRRRIETTTLPYIRPRGECSLLEEQQQTYHAYYEDLRYNLSNSTAGFGGNIYDEKSNVFISESPIRYSPESHNLKRVKASNSARVKASEFFGTTKNKYKSRITKFVRNAQLSISSEDKRSDLETTASVRKSSLSSEKDLKTHFSFKQDAVKAIGDVIDVFTDELIRESITNAMRRHASSVATTKGEQVLELDPQDIQLSLKSLGIETQVVEALKE